MVPIECGLIQTRSLEKSLTSRIEAKASGTEAKVGELLDSDNNNKM